MAGEGKKGFDPDVLDTFLAAIAKVHAVTSLPAMRDARRASERR
jgi:hypothetical protein